MRLDALPAAIASSGGALGGVTVYPRRGSSSTGA